jgi:hypothetical protein
VKRSWSAILRVACGLLVVAWAAFSLVGPLINGNFATGDLTGWNTLGSGAVVGAQGNIVPTTGSFQAQIGSGNDSEVASVVPAFGFAKPGSVHRSARPARPAVSHSGNQSSSDPNFADVAEATLESTLNLPAGAIATALPNNLRPLSAPRSIRLFPRRPAPRSPSTGTSRRTKRFQRNGTPRSTACNQAQTRRKYLSWPIPRSPAF